MIFYKMKNKDKEVFIKSNEVLLTKDDIREFAIKNNIVEEDVEWNEAYLVPTSGYTEHLLSRVYTAFSNELENIKQSWIHKTPDEICSMCYMAVYISDVMNAIDNADASDFDFEALERWLKDPKKMVETICECITNRNSSDYNEAICDFINQG